MLKLILIFIYLVSLNSAFGFVILIDPGHGGTEMGAISKVTQRNSKGKYYTRHVYEKDLTLALAIRLKRKLDKHFSTYLTRSFDRTVALEDRAEMADTVKADLFISIHFNSSRSKKSHGFETYYLDNHQDKAIKKVEAIENKGLKGENKVINQILIDLAIQKTVPTSKKLASSIHKEITSNMMSKFQIRDRGIKPGLFFVLALSKRPGVLIEAGFMSNPKEVKKLRTKNYLDMYAQSIADGIIKYHSTLPKREIPLF